MSIWFDLQIFLTAFLHVQDDILSFEEEKQAVYLQVYRPVYFQLVDVLLYKSHYPSQEDYSSWSSDDKEQFRIYRLGPKHKKKRRLIWSCKNASRIIRAIKIQQKQTFLYVLLCRVDISDTLMYVYEMLGAELLSSLYDRLGRQLMDPQLSAVWQVMSLVADSYCSI